MKKIDTRIDRVCVEIEGQRFLLKEKTIGLAERLRTVREKYRNAPGYRLWMAELRILLGRRAVKRLFTHGDRENLDRMQRIHAGVLRAFEHNAEQTEDGQLMEMLRMLCREAGLPMISRGDVQEREG